MGNRGKIKTAVIYGDSISTREIGNGGYDRFLAEQMQIPLLHNHAVAASGLAATTPNSLSALLEQPDNIHPEAELIVIWHGTNDWYWGSELGRESDWTGSTFQGALNLAVKRLRTASPEAVLLWLTPLSRREAPDQCDRCGDAWVTENKRGLTLRDYDRAIWEAGRRLCFPVVDMRCLSGFHPENTLFFQPDGVHPSERGCRRIAEVLSAQLDQYSFQ